MYKLKNEEIEKISQAITESEKYTSSSKMMENYVKSYELRPGYYNSQRDRIRYLASKRNLTLNTLESLLGLSGGSIANSSSSTNHRVDALLSAFFNVPVSDFRSLKRYRTAGEKPEQIDLKSLAKKLRKLADDVDKCC